MNSRTMFSTIVGVAVIMLVIGVAIGSVAFPITSTKTVTSVDYSVLPTYDSTICSQLETAPLFLIVKNSSTGNPLSSLTVQARQELPANNPCILVLNSGYSLILPNMQTDINGSIKVCSYSCTDSTFSFTIYDQSSAYHLNATGYGAESAECVTYYIPSGITNITFSRAFDYQC